MLNVGLLKKNMLGGGSSPLNIFMQETEPETKEGVWINTHKKYGYLLEDNDIYFANNFLTDEQVLQEIQSFTPKIASRPIFLNDKIYYSSGAVYCYDLIDKTVTNINNESTTFYCIIQNHLIYREVNYLYKQHIDTGEKTSLWSIGNSIKFTDILTDGTDLYICCYDNSGDTNEYTTQKIVLDTGIRSIITNIALRSTTARTMFYHNNHLGVMTFTGGNIVYDLLNLETNIITKHTVYLKNDNIIPTLTASISHTLVINDKLYYTGQSTSGSITYLVEIDLILNDYATYSFNKIIENNASKKINYGFYQNKLFFFSSYDNNKNIFIFYDKPFNNNTLIINKTGANAYKTEFLTSDKIFRLESTFADVYFYGDGKQEYYPMYYGNGTEWVKLKN